MEVATFSGCAPFVKLARCEFDVRPDVGNDRVATEIASAMLKRQQAEAIIAARQKIVHGAVSMVEMALTELDEGGVISLDDERKATMISNLLVVLCSESEAQPVVNTGTLYT